MDEIRLGGLRLVGTHGVLDLERSQAQPFEVDLVLGLDLGRACASDGLDDTVDYGAVVDVVAAVVGGPHVDLLEHLAGRITEAILTLDARIESVTVTVTKLRPPVSHDLATAAVRLTRLRAASA